MLFKCIFKVLTEIRNDISSRKNQLNNYLTLLNTINEAEEAVEQQKIPTIYMTETIDLEYPMVSYLFIS